MTDLFLFAVFPYLSLALALAGGLYRAARLRDSLTARSSQLLESRLQRAGALSWHWAILLVLFAHFAAIFFPGATAAVLRDPSRLYALEVSGLALGALAVAGLAVLIVRRIRLPSSWSDWILLGALLVQAASGVYVAFSLRWGSAWFLSTATPWLGSLARLSPQWSTVSVLPLAAKLHFVNAFVVIALLPLSRLMHVVTVPIAYLWRAPQLVSFRHAPPARPS